MLWSIWKTRNNLLFEDQQASLDKTITFGVQMNADFDTATQREAEPMVPRDQTHSSNLQQQEWTPPQTGFIKVSGSFIAEAQALQDGLQFAWHLRVRNVELESDSEKLIHILRREQQVPSEVEVIIGDILHLTNYMEVKFQYVKRSINNAAHVVAH
ncbi:hypothetical protein LIER_13598 [Lithospermum erythrorhizon]|uniref:RNase H type-1 domain-containing protein n=1 Tax=Lithospermum erythrorhizon TaxID=34254 RepID=A0AAV3PXM4_LITER